MKRLTLLPGLLFLMLQAAFSQESGSCKPVNLVCDYLVNPLGIDNPAPRLSWMLNDARKGARQTACQVIVDKDSLELIAGKGTIWDSGKSDERAPRYENKDRKPKDASAKDSKSTKKDKPSRAERGYSDARGPKKKDDWQEFFKDKEPDFSEEGWARRKPKKK